MNKPMYESKTIFYKIAVYQDHIEYKTIGMTNVIPISNISDFTIVPLTNVINLVLNSGEKVAVYPKKQKEFVAAVREALSKKSNSQLESSNLDELEKLTLLKDKKIVTEEEFQVKKKQLLEV